MSLELVNTLATLGTFLVIAATAIAAIVQLRHARSSNHISALNELRKSSEAADFQAASLFVSRELGAKLLDPDFRHQLEFPESRTDETPPLIAKAHAVGNFYEDVGTLIKAGMLDGDLVVQVYADPVLASWQRLAPVTAIHRRTTPGIWENFEYLTALAQAWIAAHPAGNYPSGVERVSLTDEWFEADRQYRASLAGRPAAKAVKA